MCAQTKVKRNICALLFALSIEPTQSVLRNALQLLSRQRPRQQWRQEESTASTSALPTQGPSPDQLEARQSLCRVHALKTVSSIVSVTSKWH